MVEPDLFGAPRALAATIARVLESGGVRAPPLLMAAALQYLASAYIYCSVKAMLERGDLEGARAVLQLFRAMGDIQLHAAGMELSEGNRKEGRP